MQSSALKMLAFAESRGGLANDLIEISRSLYDHLWGKHTPRDEIHAQQEIDAFLGRTKKAPCTQVLDRRRGLDAESDILPQGLLPTKLDKIKNLHSTDSIATENSGTRG